MRRLVRALAYLWASPNTLLGLTLGAVLGGRTSEWHVVDGVVEISGPRLANWLDRPWGAMSSIMAITFGHVVLAQSRVAHDFTRTHERVHVRQYERWGPAFLPAYLGASGYLWLRGRDCYRGNPFEKEAYGDEGGGV
ncbi:MAG: hypothetical protein C0478_16960 [Planctomyces sp.]|nr:hypothetical protein [Planctomyces sp.]